MSSHVTSSEKPSRTPPSTINHALLYKAWPEWQLGHREWADSGENRRWCWNSSLCHTWAPHWSRSPLSTGVRRPSSPLIDFLGTEYFQTHHKCSLSNCWNKSFREQMKELILKANKRAHLSEAAHWELMDWIWPADVFHLACAIQKTKVKAFENWEVP